MITLGCSLRSGGEAALPLCIFTKKNIQYKKIIRKKTVLGKNKLKYNTIYIDDI
jgi:hypothetical protein